MASWNGIHLLTALMIGVPACAGVIKMPETALAAAYGGASVEKKNVILSPDEASAVQNQTQEQLATKIFTFYVLKNSGKIVGYAVLHSARVRTHDETALVLITPEGKIKDIQMIAFSEPMEYLPPENWLALFDGKTLADPLRVKRDIPSITGATLSARAVTTSARISLAVWNLKVKELR